VLAVRVHKLAPKAVWEPRYEAINAFERLLTDADTVVLKFYLHISKEEQEERLLAREADPIKAWKLNADDWRERKFWKETTQAYEAALSNCSPENAPWRIVAADHKWFRDLAVAEAILHALRPYRKEWERALAEIGKRAKAELAAFREQG
jgi:polyphosphate kinase 2 (PPK2 family)